MNLYALLVLGLLLAALPLATASGADNARPDRPIRISGIYPHLATFNGRGGECGVGAVVPWAGKLWMITYPPHKTTGSPDKLYEVAPDFSVRIRPESVGGTHAGRMIHRESKQLIIGPYFIDAKGNVRAADVKNALTGRMTAVMRHLTDPANLVYFFDMEGKIYEVNVHTLAVKTLFTRPAPGDHGKGGYTAQGRVVISNNGEKRPKVKDEYGALAEWDGKTWRVVERKQFCEVTGPGGVDGAANDGDPLWATGWDRRSVILKLLDAGIWRTYRLPKASHTYDGTHGWYTEWPRIRDVGDGKLMMSMHGMFYDFPKGFRVCATGGLKPICSYLHYVPDFCDWNGALVLAGDSTSIMKNGLAGQSQSNLWFGKRSDLPGFGPRSGWGGVWSSDAVAAGETSAPFLVAGFDRTVLHLAHDADGPVAFIIQADVRGDGVWRDEATVTVGAAGYAHHIFDAKFEAVWVRIRATAACTATAYFHLASTRAATDDEDAIFASLTRVTDKTDGFAGLIRPAKHNRNLQILSPGNEAAWQCEVDEKMRFLPGADDSFGKSRKLAAVRKDFEVDDASVIMTHRGTRYRLPKSHAAFDKPFAAGWPRGVRECVSERNLANIHGTFYELPRDNGLPRIKPVATHNRKIADFCTWRGLMVLSGTRVAAKPDGNYFASADAKRGLWFGHIDDLWRLGKPVGLGGPWKDTTVRPGTASDPYLMTGYDRKTLELSHNADKPVTFTVEIDFDHTGWHTYKTFTVEPGETLRHPFADGFSAHWVRLATGQACSATAQFRYE